MKDLSFPWRVMGIGQSEKDVVEAGRVHREVFDQLCSWVDRVQEGRSAAASPVIGISIVKLVPSDLWVRSPIWLTKTSKAMRSAASNSAGRGQPVPSARPACLVRRRDPRR